MTPLDANGMPSEIRDDVTQIQFLKVDGTVRDHSLLEGSVPITINVEDLTFGNDNWPDFDVLWQRAVETNSRGELEVPVDTPIPAFTTVSMALAVLGATNAPEADDLSLSLEAGEVFVDDHGTDTVTTDMATALYSAGQLGSVGLDITDLSTAPNDLYELSQGDGAMLIARLYQSTTSEDGSAIWEMAEIAGVTISGDLISLDGVMPTAQISAPASVTETDPPADYVNFDILSLIAESGDLAEIGNVLVNNLDDFEMIEDAQNNSAIDEYSLAPSFLSTLGDETVSIDIAKSLQEAVNSDELPMVAISDTADNIDTQISSGDFSPFSITLPPAGEVGGATVTATDGDLNDAVRVAEEMPGLHTFGQIVNFVTLDPDAIDTNNTFLASDALALMNVNDLTNPLNSISISDTWTNINANASDIAVHQDGAGTVTINVVDVSSLSEIVELDTSSLSIQSWQPELVDGNLTNAFASSLKDISSSEFSDVWNTGYADSNVYDEITITDSVDNLSTGSHENI
jgi:hypothetical protein